MVRLALSHSNQGAATTATTDRGTKDLAYNNNTLYGQMSRGFQLLFNQEAVRSGSATRANGTDVTTSSASYVTLLEYRYQAMRLGQRDQIDFWILPRLTAGTSTFKVTTGADTPGVEVAFTSGESGTWKRATLDISTATDDYIRLEGKSSSGSVIVTSIHVTQATLPGATALNTVETVSGATVFVPADITQYAADAPLSVKAMRELQTSTGHIYGDATRQVVQYCFPRNYDYTDAAIMKANPLRSFVWNQDSSSYDHENMGEVATFFYKRRPGNTKLLVYINGFTENHTGAGNTGSPVNVMVSRFDAGPPGLSPHSFKTFYLNQAYGSVSWGSTWYVEGQEVDIPSGTSGLMRISISMGRGSGGSTWHGHILGLSIIEKRLQ